MVNSDKIGGRLGNRMFQLAYLFAQVKKGEIPDIYVQDYKLFQEHETEIKEWFGQGIGYLPYVAIHLRVGKNPINPEEPAYMENPFYTSLVKTGYYIKALEHFPDKKFIIFSDDMDFAKTYFEGGKFSFDDSTNDIDAFNKMSSCEGQIIANSSFSWWAAYLNPHPNKKVVCPSENSWYTDKVIRTHLPEDWIRVEP